MNAAAGVASRIPKRLVELSKKKEALSCSRIPEVPAKRTEPAVGAKNVGAPDPPETKACPVVPTAEKA